MHVNMPFRTCMYTHFKIRLALWAGPCALAVLAGCSADVSDSDDGIRAPLGIAGSSAVGGSGSSINGTAARGGGGSLIDPDMGMGGADDVDHGSAAGTGNSGVCATVNATAELEPVYLAFAFDVSGSMGAKDLPWYDPALKWDPAVKATRAFLEDATSKGLFASLTAFPVNSKDDRVKCSADTYTRPDVAMTELPSTAFGDRLDAIRSTYWGYGTPTRAVVEGVLGFVSGYREEHEGKYALVLVTDGYPQLCGEGNTISAVQDVVRDAADDVPTYVIGVKNPPLVANDGTVAPDTVSDLNGIAEAGGTEAAFIIDTGDPEKTQADFRKAIDAIRGAAIACSVGLPTPPDGRTFQKDHVLVSRTEGDATTKLEYDQECQSADAWRYDSTTQPKEVVLCPSACTRLHDAKDAKLRVGFTCEQVITVR